MGPGKANAGAISLGSQSIMTLGIVERKWEVSGEIKRTEIDPSGLHVP